MAIQRVIVVVIPRLATQFPGGELLAPPVTTRDHWCPAPLTQSRAQSAEMLGQFPDCPPQGEALLRKRPWRWRLCPIPLGVAGQLGRPEAVAEKPSDWLLVQLVVPCW